MKKPSEHLFETIVAYCLAGGGECPLDTYRLLVRTFGDDLYGSESEFLSVWWVHRQECPYAFPYSHYNYLKREENNPMQ